MPCNFTLFLLEQNWAVIVRALLPASRTLRELADLCGMSPAGTRDVLRRLITADVIRPLRQGKKTLYQLELNTGERRFLERAVAEKISSEVRSRAEIYSRRSVKDVDWIDETLRAVRHGKRTRSDSA